MKILRKIVVPYKRANKRLKEMESEQGKIENILTQMDEKFILNIEDLNRCMSKPTIESSYVV